MDCSANHAWILAPIKESRYDRKFVKIVILAVGANNY